MFSRFAAALLVLACGMLVQVRTLPLDGGAPQDLDVVINNGRVMDPASGLDGIRSIGIAGDRVVQVSERPLIGRDTIDARGHVVSPGFIDLHQHAHHPAAYRLQVLGGVTTALDLEEGTADVAGWYEARSGKTLINYGTSISHLHVRRRVMQADSAAADGPAFRTPATTTQRSGILDGLLRGLRDGAPAVGLMIEYTPGATPWEVYEVFKVAAANAAPVHAHVRSLPPSLYFLETEEIIAAAAMTGASVQVVHLQSSSGEDSVQVLEMIRAARSRGIDISTEIYPYTASMTGISSAAYADWQSWPEHKFSRFEWPPTGERLTRESFARYRAAGGLVAEHNNTEAVIRAVLADPLPMFASDGVLDGDAGHPRVAGTYARILGRYVRDERILTLMEALRRMTIEPARRLEKRVPAMARKGRIAVGGDADLVIFDPATIADRATYRQPTLPSVGIRDVFVNGVAVVRNASVQDGRFPGRAIRHRR